jgi:hypothetical protein
MLGVMRYLVLAFVAFLGCAEAENARAMAPPLGPAHDGSADTIGDAVSDAGRACEAAVETLSGRATYVQGSARAADPGAPSVVVANQTCADYVRQFDASSAASVTVASGQVGKLAAALEAAIATDQGCAYTLRVISPPWNESMQPPNYCAISRDYVLVVP